MPIKKFLPGNTTATTATTPTTATTATTTTNVTDCYDVHQQNKLLPGVYSIQVDTQTTVNVSCLASGWTVFQSRGQYGNPTDYFFKGWSDYENGFGTRGKILHSSRTTT